MSGFANSGWRRVGAAFRRVATVLLVVAAGGVGEEGRAQESLRERIEHMEFPDLRFTPPESRSGTVRGVPVYFLEDRALPLVTFYATFKGGLRHFDRDYFAAASAVPALLRTGGTSSLPPDSVDHRIELLALSMSFGQGGGGASSWINSLSEGADDALSLWADMLRRPRFDPAHVELWRQAENERVRRRGDEIGTLAFGLFNRIMYGRHPIGWEMSAADLEPGDLSEERLRFVHEAVICPDNMVLGVVGDLSWERALSLADTLLDGWPPCSGELGDDPVPQIRPGPGVFVLHRETEQSVIVMAQSSPVRQGDTGVYFASRIGNSILGAAGFSSRLMSALRTREGLTYGASSLWNSSTRHDGLVGALTRTKPESALAAVRMMIRAFDSLRTVPPDADEVSQAVDEAANGFVFNFQSPFQIVARNMAFQNLGLPGDWLERYLRGISRVTPVDVLEVFQSVDPDAMVILLVGDTTRFVGSPSELGPVSVLDDPASFQPAPVAVPRPSRRYESPRFRR